jgi:hypothetical protein
MFATAGAFSVTDLLNKKVKSGTVSVKTAVAAQTVSIATSASSTNFDGVLGLVILSTNILLSLMGAYLARKPPRLQHFLFDLHPRPECIRADCVPVRRQTSRLRSQRFRIRRRSTRGPVVGTSRVAPLSRALA